MDDAAHAPASRAKPRRPRSQAARTALLLRHVPGVYLLFVLGQWVMHAAWGFSNTKHLASVSQHMGERPATYLLMGCLACTPIVRILGVAWAGTLRKPLGMYAFAYGSMSLFAFWAQHDFVVARTVSAILHQPFVIAGVVALLLYVPLAVTSTTRAVKRMGGKRWRALHRLTYVAGAVVMLHLLLLPGDAHAQAPLPVTVFSTLMLLRVPLIRKYLRGRVVALAAHRPQTVRLAGAGVTVAVALGVSMLASVAADPGGPPHLVLNAMHQMDRPDASTQTSAVAEVTQAAPTPSGARPAAPPPVDQFARRPAPPRPTPPPPRPDHPHRLRA